MARSSRSTIGDLERDLSDARRRAEQQSEETHHHRRRRRRLSWEDEERGGAAASGPDGGGSSSSSREEYDRQGKKRKRRRHRSPGDGKQKKKGRGSGMARLGLAGAVGFGLGFLVATVRKLEAAPSSTYEHHEYKEEEEEVKSGERPPPGRGRRRRRRADEALGYDLRYDDGYEYERRPRDRSFDRRREESRCSRARLEYTPPRPRSFYEEERRRITGGSPGLGGGMYSQRRPSDANLSRCWLDDDRPYYNRY